MRPWRSRSTNGRINDWDYGPILWLIALVLDLLAAACAVPTNSEVEVTAGSLHITNEAIILFPAARERNLLANTKFARCLRTKIEEKVTPRPKIMDTAAFRDATFPWFEFERAPRTVEEMNTLLSRPLVRQRIASLNVRYLISIAGDTESGIGFPGLLCGYGCFGLAWGHDTSRLSAVVWDIVRGDQAGTLLATTSGTSVAPAFIIPFFFIAYTQDDACEALAAEIGQRLYGPSGAKTTDP